MPDMIIIAGPNGAGKSTFGDLFLRRQTKPFTYINADEIEKELAEFQNTKSKREFSAARFALRRLAAAVDAGDNLMIETTLAVRTYANAIPKWQLRGYRVGLSYLRLPSPEAAIERVRRRVMSGGHDIPEDVIRRRFETGRRYLETLYKPIVDEWYVWNSTEGGFVPAEAWNQP